MSKFAHDRRGGRAYTVRVTDGKNGQMVDTVHVVAIDVRRARQAAIEHCKDRVIDASNLHAHAPQRA
jgi:hypothetical protein